MASDVKNAGIKQLKVDNWSSYLLQRMQLLFAKGDSCDITLRFHTGQELKVHSLVIRTCTSHFDTLPKNDNVIILPEVLSYSAVFPIINFMYSGKLEFKQELQQKLLNIARILNISILLKLLMAQKGDNSGAKINGRPKVQQNTDGSKASTSQGNSPSTPSMSFSMFSGKKLPFWRKRTLPIMKYSGRKPVEDEPGPTRFNWPENEPNDWLLFSSPSFCPLSYHTDPIVQAPIKLEPPPVYTPMPPRRIIESRMVATHDSDDDDDRFEDTYSSEEDTPPIPPTPPPVTPPTPTVLPQTPPLQSVPSTPLLKPCLKTPSTDTPTGPPCKRVRFSLGPEGKENSVQSTASNHAKIIAEVLKKYPDLVKNKNIKLKISSPKPKIENGLGSDDRASYVVLRPTVKSPVTSSSNTPKQTDQNTWTCDHCVEIKFDNYQDFRKHIQETHGEKIDSRICEYCGYKASKRNLHLYHLFTKHNVPPPKNINFPKCSVCCYIALTDTLLAKHMNNHQLKDTKEPTKDFQCDICKTIMKNQASLCAHKVTCKPGNEPRNIICELCKATFKTNVSLNAHLKECQGKHDAATATLFSENGEQQPVEMIEVPIIEAVNMEKGDHTLVQIPSGIILADNQNMTLLPSGESEALTSVATGIATSIGLTVASVAYPQDQQAVILLHGNGPEYIVPDFLEGSFTAAGDIAYTTGQNQVIYLESSPGNGNQQEVIHLEEIKINQTSPSTSAIHTDNLSGKRNNVVETTLRVPMESEGERETQNVIINVQGSLSQAASAQLEQSGLILINTSKPVHTVEQSEVQQNVSENVVLRLASGENDKDKPLEDESLQVDDHLEANQQLEDKSLEEDSHKTSDSTLLSNAILQESISLPSTSSLSSGAPLKESISSHDNESLRDNMSTHEIDALQESCTLSDGNCLQEFIPSQENDSLHKDISSSNSDVSQQQMTQENVQENFALQEYSTFTRSPPEKGGTPPCGDSTQEETSTSLTDIPLDENITVEIGGSNSTSPTEENSVSNEQEIPADTEKPEKGAKTKVAFAQSLELSETIDKSIFETTQIETAEINEQQSSCVTNQVRTDTDDVDKENVDTTMDVCNEESKEKDEEMETDDHIETGDERVDSLVKDWGFDDEDSEEIIDDPDCKPLRPELDL